MKNLIFIVLGAIIGALGMHYYGSKVLSTEDITTEFGDFAEKYQEPEGLISVAYGDTLSTNWTKYRKPAVDSCAAMGGHKQDDRSVWWPAKELKNYLKYTKKKADSMKYKVTGYRIYLGVYGQEAGTEKCDLSTMFIVPTGRPKKKKDDLKINNFAPAAILQGGGDLPLHPLNRGHGGGNGYP